MPYLDEVECPYCEESFDLNHDDGAYYDESERREAECPNCGKISMVNSSCDWSFEAEKADCLNDGEHNWKKMSGVPSEFFVEMYRCEHCDEEKCFDEKKRREAIKKSFKK